MILVKNRQERNRFLRFMSVGTIGAVVDFGVMNFLSHSLNMELVFAGSISFVCAIISNFIWNRFWTYPDSRSRPIGNQLVMFFLVNLAGMAIRIPILYYLEPEFFQLLSHISISLPFSTEFLAKNGTLALAVTIVMLWNFFVNRYWTYNDINS
jgi:putative flippase GtrA